MQVKKKRPNGLTGWLVGLFAPAAGFVLFSLLYFTDQSVLTTIKTYAERHVLTHVISLSAIVNLLLFFTFLKMNRDLDARGVLGATFLYVLAVVILKFF